MKDMLTTGSPKPALFRGSDTAAGIVIRDIETTPELRAVEDMQREVWGIPDLDVVPLAHLIAVKTAGGVLIGAFDAGVLVGFVYGFPGIENGEQTHHSHMLAVSKDHRGAHIGERLKLAQREQVLRQGVKVISWTFDPLRSKNAYLNFRKLGVTCEQYFVDFYGYDAASFLHRNGTDRFWVTWRLDSPSVFARIERSEQAQTLTADMPILAVGEREQPILQMPVEFSETLAIEIPADISSVEERSQQLAIEWRRTARQAFTTALDRGYTVVDFVRGEGKGSYILTR